MNQNWNITLLQNYSFCFLVGARNVKFFLLLNLRISDSSPRHSLSSNHWTIAHFGFLAAAFDAVGLKGQPCAWVHGTTEQRPLMAASLHVSTSHGHQWRCVHWSMGKFPLLAAHLQTFLSHGQSCSRTHCNNCRLPRLANIHISRAAIDVQSLDYL